MNLSQLEVLIAIVDSGNLTDAGEAVGLTQSAVSYSLSKLEAELGVILLERGRQGIVVTRIGEDVLQHARSILSHIEVIRQKTTRERGISVGKIRFGTVPNVSSRLLLGILRDFQHRYPQIEVVMFEGNIEEVMGWLNQNVIDVGTALTSAQYPSAVKLGKIEVKVLVSVNHPLANRTAIPLDTLANETLIGSRAEYEILLGLPELQNYHLPALHYEASVLKAIYAMVRENMGVSILHDRLIDPKAEGVVALALTPPLFLNMYLVASQPSSVVEGLFAAATSWVKEHGFFPEVS